MSGARLTIAIPFRDEERHLGAAVRSVLAQTFAEFELVLVDDGSRDSSLAIARSFRDGRVQVRSDGLARGLPARLNEIVRMASADLVARMDADDVIHPTRLAKQYAYLAAHPSCHVVGSWIGLVDDDEAVIGVTETAELPPTASVALARGIMAHASIVARRRWLLDHPYDETLTRAEDRDLWVRTVRDTEFGVVPEPLYVVRIVTRDPRFVADYGASQRQNAVIALRYGPRMIGWRRTARLVGAAHAKTAVMRAAHALGVAPRLVRRRGRAATSAELQTILEALSTGAQRP